MIMDPKCSQKSYLWIDSELVDRRLDWLTLPIRVKGEFVRVLSLLMREVGSRIGRVDKPNSGWSIGSTSESTVVVDYIGWTIQVND